MLESSPENVWNAILLPSGDQAGAESGAEFVVNVEGIPFGVKRKISEFPKRLLTKAISFAIGDQTGLLKLLFELETRKLLGVHIIGTGASELIHIGQAVIHANETIDRFIDTTFNIPTRSEAYKYAAYDALRRMAAPRPG